MQQNSIQNQILVGEQFVASIPIEVFIAFFATFSYRLEKSDAVPSFPLLHCLENQQKISVENIAALSAELTRLESEFKNLPAQKIILNLENLNPLPEHQYSLFSSHSSPTNCFDLFEKNFFSPLQQALKQALLKKSNFQVTTNLSPIQNIRGLSQYIFLLSGIFILGLILFLYNIYQAINEHVYEQNLLFISSILLTFSFLSPFFWKNTLMELAFSKDKIGLAKYSTLQYRVIVAIFSILCFLIQFYIVHHLSLIQPYIQKIFTIFNL